MTETRTPLSDIESEARAVLAAATADGIPLRALGGLAVRLQVSGQMPTAVSRRYKDIDVMTTKSAGRSVAQLLEAMGYDPHKEFNALNAGRRLLFYDVGNERQLDVFIGSFHMCHTVPLDDRLEVDPVTLPLAELLLTKLQIVELNEKDQQDILVLLLSHDVGEGDDDRINGPRIARLLAADWGLWRTTQLNLERTAGAASRYGLADAERARVAAGLEVLRTLIDQEPKSGKWKLRDRIGDRKRWYEVPDEVER